VDLKKATFVIAKCGKLDEEEKTEIKSAETATQRAVEDLLEQKKHLLTLARMVH